VRRIAVMLESVSIDRSLDALSAALEAAAVAPPNEPASSEPLDRVEPAIAPLRLPADLRRFWERIDPTTLNLWAFPQPVKPEFALDSWRQGREEFPGQMPAVLFLVGYESWNCMSVELDSPLGEGGALFQWRLEDGGFYLRYHRLTDWIDRMTDLVSTRQFVRRDGHSGPILHLQDPETALALSAPRGKLPPHQVYGGATSIDRDRRRWPGHWQRLSGLNPADIAPRGPTHSIAEVLNSDPALILEATIAGRVEALAGSGNMTRVRVNDGTGVIAISCPAAVTALGPGRGRSFEFDVLVPAGARQRPADPDALVKTGEAVRDLSNYYQARYGGPAGAVATAIRPLDD
jgi:hypothetical protein